MKNTTLALAMAGAILLGGLAAPALALVDDRPNALTTTAERDLERRLSRLGAHRFDVVFVDRTVGAPSRMAKDEFQRRKLGPKDGVILVAVKSKQVGVHVGTAFVQRGVVGPVVADQIQRSFLPAAKRGDFAQASSDLARGLIAAGATNAPVTSGNRRVSSNVADTQPTRRSGGGGGFPWGVLLVVAAGGVGVWFYLNKQKGANLQARLDALRASQEAIMTGALKLGEVDQLGRFHEGPAAAAYKTLAKRSEKLLRKATWFGNKFTDAEQAIAAKKSGEAEGILAELEKEATALEAGVMAAVSVLDQLESGATPSAEALSQVDLPEQVEAVARELKEVSASYAQERSRARKLGVGDDAEIEGRLEDAKRCITEAPLDVKEAQKALGRARNGIVEYRQRIEAEADREVEREAQREAQRAQQRHDGAWMAAAAAPTVISHLGHDSHHHHHESSAWDSGASAEGSWGASDEGASADGSWGDSDSSDDNSAGW